MTTATAERVETTQQPEAQTVQDAVQAWRSCLEERLRIEEQLRRLEFALVAAKRQERRAYERALQVAV